HQGVPHDGATYADLTQEETLDCAATGDAAAEQPGRKHARVVDDQQIAPLEDIDEMSERGVLASAGLPPQHERARLPAHGGRVLRDQPGREIEIEIADIHDFRAPRRVAAGLP